VSEATEPNVGTARYTAVVRFREDQAVVTVASERARAQGTQLASIMRYLLRQWLAGVDKGIYKGARDDG